MSTSLLYHTQGTKDFQFQAFKYSGGRLTARIVRSPDRFECSRCGRREVTATPVGTRRIRGLPMGSKQCDLQVQMHRVRCHQCGAYLTEVLPFLPNQKARVTRALARSVVELRPEMSISALARHFDLHWITVKDIEKADLKEKYKRIKLRDVRHLGIDEVHTGKCMGEKGYLTIVRDMQSGSVLHIGKGRGGDALKGFEQRIRRSKCSITAVAMDFSPAYTAWASRVLPNATLVYDHFHLIELMNEKIDGIRRRVMGQLEENEKKALKNRRWHFIRNQEDLDADAKEELDQCRAQFADLGTAWFMKEALRRIYSLAWDAQTAGLAFDRWCELAEASELPQLKTMAKTIRRHRDGITAYWTTGMTSAGMEGFNNKIRWLNSQAYGYRDEEYFILKIFDLPSIRTRRNL